MIRKELDHGRRAFLYPYELDRIMGDDVALRQLYASLQKLRKRGVIEQVPGIRGAFRLRQNSPKAVHDRRGRKPGGFARNW